MNAPNVVSAWPSFSFFVPHSSALAVGSVIWNQAGKYKAQRITEIRKEIEVKEGDEGKRGGERERSFEHVASRSITSGGRGVVFAPAPSLLHGRRDSSFSSFSSTTCSLDGLRGEGGGSCPEAAFEFTLSPCRVLSKGGDEVQFTFGSENATLSRCDFRIIISRLHEIDA